MKEEREVHPHELIAALIDGLVTPAEREAVQSHLGICKPCRLLLRDLQRLPATAGADAAPPPSDPAARIRWRLRSLEAARAQPPPPACSRWLAPLPLSAAAGLVLAFAALWGLRNGVGVSGGGRGEAGLPAGANAAAQASPPAPISAGGAPPAVAQTPAVPQASAPPAAPAPTAEPRQRRPQPPPSDPPLVVAPAAVEKAAPLAGDRPAEERADGGAPARTGRLLSLELPDLRIEVDEAGALSVDAERYSCTVPLEVGEVEHLFRLTAGSSLGALGDLAMVPEGIDPALARRGRRVLTRSGAAAEGFQAIEYLDLPERPAPALLREIEALLVRLVRSDARARLESACGPPP
jgi:hypothetical protein